MSHDIVAGDKCLIVQGFSQKASPNVGKTVLVGHTVLGTHGEAHSKFGRIVRITGEEVYQMNDLGEFFNAGWADIPVAWLQKIDPDKAPDESVKTENTITA